MIVINKWKTDLIKIFDWKLEEKEDKNNIKINKIIIIIFQKYEIIILIIIKTIVFVIIVMKIKMII